MPTLGTYSGNSTTVAGQILLIALAYKESFIKQSGHSIEIMPPLGNISAENNLTASNSSLFRLVLEQFLVIIEMIYLTKLYLLQANSQPTYLVGIKLQKTREKPASIVFVARIPSYEYKPESDQPAKFKV